MLHAAAFADEDESLKTFAFWASGVKVGLGWTQTQSDGDAVYKPGLAFATGAFTSWGIKAAAQVQVEVNFLGRGTLGRDEVLLGGAPTGMFRDTSYEISEVQGGALFKLGAPVWTKPEKHAGLTSPHVHRKRRSLPYVAGGAMWSRVLESKRVIRLDSPGSLPQSDVWMEPEGVALEWVGAAGFEYNRTSGGGLGFEGRVQIRDKPVPTGLGDSVKMITYLIQTTLLF